MPRLHLDRFWRITVIANRLTSSLTRFLRKQDCLHTFDMCHAGLMLENGLKILQAMAGKPYQPNYRMHDLNLEDFFTPRISVFRVEKFTAIIGCFHRLNTLSLNYNYLSEEILQTLMKNNGHTLQYLHIRAYRIDPNFHSISSQVWRAAKRLAPKLQVSLYSEGIGDYTTMTRILSPEMPMTVFQFWTGLHHQDQDWHLPRTLMYITDNFGETIGEYVYLGFE